MHLADLPPYTKISLVYKLPCSLNLPSTNLECFVCFLILGSFGFQCTKLDSHLLVYRISSFTASHPGSEVRVLKCEITILSELWVTVCLRKAITFALFSWLSMNHLIQFICFIH